MSKENTAVTKKKIKRCKEDVVFDAACFIILTLVLFVVAYPLYWVIISSISAPSAVSSGKVLLHPIGFTLKGYAEVFKNDQVMRGFLNSLIITFCGVMVNLIVTLPTSYALSRSNFSGKKPITIFYLITMFFGGGMIPKLKNCIDAIEHGVNRVHILDGRIPHSLLLEIFTNKGIGTAILKDDGEKYYNEHE